MSGKWSTPRRCNCKDPVTGKELGRNCPKFQGQTKPTKKHPFTFGYSTRIPVSTDKAGVRELRRFGFTTKTEADAAAEKVWDLIKLAGDDVRTQQKIGDMIFEKSARGGELPAVDDVRRRLGLRRDPGEVARFGEAWDAWLAGKRKARPSYIKWLREVGRNWLLPFVLADIPLERVNGEGCALVFSRIDDFNEEIDLAAEAGRAPNVPEDVRKAGKHVGVSTQHGIYRALRAFLNFQWKKAHAIPFNPVYMVELEPEVHAVPLTWSPEQVGLFLAFHEGDRLIFLWRLALLRGFRRGELCGMADADFDAGEGAVTVNAALLEIGGQAGLGQAEVEGRGARRRPRRGQRHRGEGAPLPPQAGTAPRGRGVGGLRVHVHERARRPAAA